MSNKLILKWQFEKLVDEKFGGEKEVFVIGKLENKVPVSLILHESDDEKIKLAEAEKKIKRIILDSLLAELNLL